VVERTQSRPDLRLELAVTTATTATEAGAQLTVRAVVLGIVLAAVMAVANTYLGLFASMTIASAIPSAVVSMAVLKLLGGGTILENNIVQTGGSAGSSTATGVIFTTPAFVILGYWNHYDYAWVFAFAALGGVLGVLFTVPLRRALIIEQKLRFPEGVAAAEVLRAGSDPTRGAKLLGWAAVAGGALKLVAANGLRLIPDNAGFATWMGKSIAYLNTSVSAALLGVGYLCGVNAGLVIAAGGIIAFNIAIPLYAQFFLQLDPALSAAVAGLSASDAAGLIWSKQIRYVGVGTMLIGGLWTIFSIRGAVINSLRAAMGAAKRIGSASVDHREQDLSLRTMLIGVGLCTIPLFIMYHSVVGSVLVSIPMTIAMIILAFIFCAVSAYLTGLVGGSNDPVSGMIISTVLAGSALLLALTGGNAVIGPVAAVMIGAAVCCALCVASDNLQDLKCGHLVGATPWRQQVMLAIGVVTSALVLAPVLNLLSQAYGIGVADALHPKPLSAAQSVLIASVAKGLFGGTLPWNMVIIGALLGVLVIGVDEWLKSGTSGIRTPVLAVAVGVYLPQEYTLPIGLGGVLAYLVERANRRSGAGSESLAGRGMLLAAGAIAGESLMGVVIAIPIVASGRADVLALPESMQQGPWLGLLLLALFAWLMYRTATRRAT
jgi:putative OPT family oligopeptide transporter